MRWLAVSARDGTPRARTGLARAAAAVVCLMGTLGSAALQALVGGDGAVAPSSLHAWQDNRFLYVESDGMAGHVLMVGIRSWQQQVPLRQPYRGFNAWMIPPQPLADHDADPAGRGTAQRGHRFRVGVDGSAAWRLEYGLAGRTHRVDYRVEGSRHTFVFTDPPGATRTEACDR